MTKKKKSLVNEVAPVVEGVLENGHEEGATHKVAFPVVGIGASAGGLAAFEAFFSGMPSNIDPGMAFVLIQHLAPDYKSILSDLIQRFTRMQVFEVEDGIILQPNCVYIIPPNCDLAILKGKLHLLQPIKVHGYRLPIDFFFRSLAQDQHERAICIVLSGTGSDGQAGLREIKGGGGMAMAQLPQSAEYDGMPQSAINTGLVDYILPPAEMPAKLILYTSCLSQKKGKAISPVGPSMAKEVYSRICLMLRDQTGHDFSEYKESTINRRVERRMVVHQILSLDEYVFFLQRNMAERQALFCDLLIGVTSFFRDPEAFAALASHIVPGIFAGKAANDLIRVWVVACSTGEEAYSIAMLLQELMEQTKQFFKVQVFATDIDSRAIETARAGVYPASIALDVSPERLARFFTLQEPGEGYRINKSIRDMLVFSEQDVIRDPPFSKLDLVSCRNLLIYMGGPLQQKLIPLFHYALNLGGLLLLGTSESVGDFRDLFAALDRKAKLYVSKNNEDGEQRHAMRQFIKPVSRGEGSPLSRGGKLSTVARKETRRELTERVMLNHFTPASILVTRSGEILYLHGRTGKYLEMATGDIGVNILRMAREGLRRDLTTALHAAITHKEKVSRPGLRVKTNGDFSTVNLTVYPVAPCIEAEGEKPSAWTHTVSGARAGYESGVDSFQYLVILEDAPEPVPVVAATVNPADLAFGAELNPTDTQVIIATLRQELRSKDEYLQSATEELEVSGEEMQSVNEELQSSNEELETSKEELQSINEELSTVNAELQNKVLSLLQANNDMNNLLAGTGVGTVFVNQQLCIQRFTPAVTGLINLIPTDIGRPIGHTVTNLLDYHCLENDVQAVLDTLLPIEIEVQTKAGAWFLMCIRPYRTLENVPEGVVINFIEISRMVAAQESLRRLAVVVNDAHDAITMVDLMGRILAWNPAAERLYGWSEAEALAMNVRELIPEGLRLEALAKVHQLVQAETLEPYQTHRLTKDGRDITVWVTATALLNKAGEVYAIASTERHHGLEL